MVFPKEQIVKDNISVYYVCITEEDVYWKFNKRNLPENAEPGKKEKFNYLKISNITSWNEGKYQCMKVDGTTIDEVTLTVGK